MNNRVVVKELQKIIKQLRSSLLYATELIIALDNQRLRAIKELGGK